MTTLEQLQVARSLVAKGWTQNESARDADGYATSPFGDKAISFCAYGALARANPHDDRPAGFALIAAIPRYFAHFSDTNGHRLAFLLNFNDDPSTTKADVLALYDRAIQEAG